MATEEQKPRLKVRLDRVYGNPVIYPVCDKAKAIASLAGTKTIAPAKLGICIKQLGFVVQVDGYADTVEVSKMVGAALLMPVDVPA